MANTDARAGLIPIKHRNGAPYTGSPNSYFINASYATELFIGDPVVKNGTSNTSGVEGTFGTMFAAGTLPEIEKATAGDSNFITGVIVGFMATKTNLETTTSPASTQGVAFVVDDPDVVFEIQEDNAGAALAATDVGLNANLIFTHAGSSVTGLSGVELDGGSNPSANASFQLTIQRLVNRPADNAIGASAKWEVKINRHTEAANVIGI